MSQVCIIRWKLLFHPERATKSDCRNKVGNLFVSNPELRLGHVSKDVARSLKILLRVIFVFFLFTFFFICFLLFSTDILLGPECAVVIASISKIVSLLL